MKKSELRQIIREELLNEGSNDLKKQITKIDKMIQDMYSDLEMGFDMALDKADMQGTSRKLAKESFTDAEKYLRIGVGKVNAIIDFMKKQKL